MKIIIVDEVPENPYSYQKTSSLSNAFRRGQKSLLSSAVTLEELDKPDSEGWWWFSGTIIHGIDVEVGSQFIKIGYADGKPYLMCDPEDKSYDFIGKWIKDPLPKILEMRGK